MAIRGRCGLSELLLDGSLSSASVMSADLPVLMVGEVRDSDLVVGGVNDLVSSPISRDL